MVYLLDSNKSSSSSKDKHDPNWILLRSIRNIKDLKVYADEAGVDKEKDDEKESYLILPKTGDISSVF